MDKLNIFIPLAKFDAARRRAYGVMTAEAPDKSGEIMDYASGKPAIQLWSESLAKATDGKNKGNVRVMHGRAPKFGALPVGRVVEIDFDDLNKSVQVCVEIDDDDALAMCEKGTLTGFSIGGGYAKRWADGMHKRYTPILSELSLVDNPCLGGASFELVKADGIVEKVLLAGFDPGADATKAYADKLAKDAGKDDRRNDFLVQARDELIKAHIENGDIFTKGDDDVWSMVKVAPTEEPAADAPLEKIDSQAVDPVDAVAAALAKAIAVPAAVAGSDDPFTDLAKMAPVMLALAKIAAEKNPLAKDLYNVSWLAELMERFSTLQACLSWEAKAEGDGSTAPQAAADILKQIGDLLVSVAKEEVAEAVTSMNEMGGVEVEIENADVLEMAVRTMDLVKCDLALMEKVGARNSRSDASRIKAIHDHAVNLGADCAEGAAAEKLAKSEDEIGRLSKALTEALPGIEKLGATVAAQAEELAKAARDNAAMGARLKALEDQPAPPKGVLRVIGKDEDTGGLRKDADDIDTENMTPLQKALALEGDPIKRASIIMRFSGGGVPGQGPRS